MLSLVLRILLALAPLAQAARVANLNVSEATAAKYDCDSTCYENFQTGIASDLASYGTIYDVDFYKTAHNFSTSKPGDILKLKPINSTLLSGIPYGTTAFKFQYVSEDLDGKKVPVTGFIAFPYASRNNGHKFPTIAFAHGTSGVFRGCAPSAMPDLYEYGSWAFLVARGYAVVATDYAGLGNDYIGHQYMASPAQANDLYYSIAAARKVFHQYLTSEWMSVGHSQGGGAVWALAESPLVKKNPLSLGKYLGTVAQAPATRLKDMALIALEASSSSAGASSSRGVLVELGWVVLGLRNILPGVPQTWLQPKFRERLELATIAQACFDSMEYLVADLSFADVVNISDSSLYYALDVIQNLTARGSGRNEQPLLVVQGLSDTSVLPAVVEDSQNISCHSGNEVHLHLYPGLNHDEVIPSSAPSFLQWMDERFYGIHTSGKCSNQTIKPFDLSHMYAPTGTD